MRLPETPSDEALLGEGRPGAAGTAFATFYVRNERGVLAYFLLRVRSAELAADLTSETFAQALASRHRFRSRGPGSATAWLFGIAAHVLSRSLRRRQVETHARGRIGLPPLVLEDEHIAAIEALGDDASTIALERLPPALRDAVHARVLDERGYEDIASQLRCSPSVARKRVSRGLALLRRSLRESA